MGRPIQKKWFGPAASGVKIIVNGAKWADGTTSTNAYIVKQRGENAYVVSNGSTKTETLFMVNATSVGALAAGQCFITVTVFGSGAVLPASKIMQYRVDVFEADGSRGSYTWSTQPANAVGQVDLITAAELGGPVNTVAPAVTPGSGTVAGSTLFTSTAGTWTGNPTITFAYQWYVGGTTAITGATASTYTATAPGIGSVTCRVTATNGIGSTVATSNAVTITA